GRHRPDRPACDILRQSPVLPGLIVAHRSRACGRRNSEHAVLKPLVVAAVAAIGLAASTTSADPLACNLSAYTVTPGLAAAVAGETLTVTWDGAKSQELRLRFGIDGGTPTIRDLAIR